MEDVRDIKWDMFGAVRCLALKMLLEDVSVVEQPEWDLESEWKPFFAADYLRSLRFGPVRFLGPQRVTFLHHSFLEKSVAEKVMFEVIAKPTRSISEAAIWDAKTVWSRHSFEEPRFLGVFDFLVGFLSDSEHSHAFLERIHWIHDTAKSSGSEHMDTTGVNGRPKVTLKMVRNRKSLF